MNKHIIRTSETDSVKGIPTKQQVEVNLKQTTKSLPFPNVSTTISQRNVYEEERQAGNKFRLILTVVPYCSNVLFNPLTEIIKDEGSDKPIVVTDNNNDQTIKEAYGVQSPSRIQMISNTEYSSVLHGGYEYHPGYDFFDNHILRNKTFKVVNPIGNGDRNVFNTLKDFVRDREGVTRSYTKRTSITETSQPNKHLYLIDDILKIDESINENLYEENGWWGFVNNTSIDAKERNSTIWESMDISRALNNHRPCEFIDMYPDRTLFSFTPKYNKYKNKEENNWNVIVTYPYKNVYTHPICLGGTSYIKRRLNSSGEQIEDFVSEGNKWMGLKVMNAQISSGKAGGNNLVIRTYTKHGLSKGEMFYLYYTNPYKKTNDKYGDDSLNGKEIFYESDTFYKVTNVGNLNRDGDGYCFYTSNLALVEEIYKSFLKYYGNKGGNKDDDLFDAYNNDDHKGIYDKKNELKVELLNKILNNTNFRIRRCVSGVKSTYYMRLFRKIPNLRAAKRMMTDEEKLHKAKFNGAFDEFVKENATDPQDPTCQRLLNNEQYQMAFAANIFNDNVSQITFMDGIDTEGLTDNLGRPLSEIYYTVVKNNAGYKNWYNGKIEAKDIEFSHCFGKLTSGLKMYFKKDDPENVTVPVDYLKKLSSANHITNVVNNESGVGEDKDSNNLDDDISYKNTFFYGDLVEYNAMDFQEKTLSKVMHRFNTAQRELIENKSYSKFRYHEITADDYDLSEFTVDEYSATNGKIETGDSSNDYSTIVRPEGYIYEAHYPIPIREYTRIKQGSYYTLRIRNAKPIQKDGILIQVTTLLAHHLTDNDIIFICDDVSDIRYVTRCVKTINQTTFLMSPDYTEIINNATNFEDGESVSNINKDGKYIRRFSWLELCEILNGNYGEETAHPKLILRRKNNDIPDYATYIGNNQYIWRDIVNIGDSRARVLPDYIFANGYFYVTQKLNFYLKRQDPFGNNGLYFDGDTNYPNFPNDPSGVMQKENNFLVKDTEAIC